MGQPLSIIKPWNWDAIFALINIITVGALVFINWKYLKKLSEQIDSTNKDRERNKILEGVQHVLIPNIHNLKGEINEITNGTRTYFGRNFHVFFKGERYYTYAFWDIMEEFTILPDKLHENDKLAEKLNILYKKIDEEVTDKFESDKFNKRLIDMINSYNRSNSDALGTETRAHFVLENICKEYIISEWDLSNNVPRVSEHENNFLKENKDELQTYKDIPTIRKLSKQIKDTSNMLKNSDEDILEIFKEITNKHREVYNFTEREMDPR
ncbi:hypothetical protein C5S31_02245 [ANME-1 cluster archaeon GoMg2]|nr:hypothetical protein [ANME-1 cluster archaeon GoMg2]